MGTTNALFRLTLFQVRNLFAYFQKNKTKAMAVDVARRGRKQQCYAACDWLDDEFFHFRAKIENARAIPTLVVYVCIMLN